MAFSGVQRFRSPYQLLEYMNSFAYADFEFLMSPAEVFDTCTGSCHDQVMLELDELGMQGLNPQAMFIMAMYPEQTLDTARGDTVIIGGETHSFVYWEKDGKCYWFENAWRDYQGLHEFDSEQDLLDAVISAFAERNPDQYIYLASFDPDEHAIGEDLDTLVDTCMDNAKRVV